MRDIIEYCQIRKRKLIVVYDANTQHILWGSTGINPRRESVMEFLVSSNLNILNRSNVPNFVVRKRKGVINLTLRTIKIGDLYVIGRYLMSRHCQI
jgi:hypothetical protein